MRRTTLLVTMLALGLVGSSSPAVAADAGVGVGDDFFAPSRVAVTPGGTVTWNHSPGIEQHNVHFDDEGFGDPSPDSGQWTRTRTFPTTPNPGTYRYHCDVHGAAMSGVVYVNDLGNLPPFVAFAANPNPAETGQTVSFDANLSSDDDGIKNLKWDLDGNDSFETDTGTMRTTSHVYTSAGTVNVKLRVTDTKNLTDERTVPVQINAPPPPPPPPPPPGSSGGGAPIFTAPTAIADTTRPSVSDYGMSNKAFQAGKASTPTSGSAAKKKTAVTGTTFRYKLSEAATVKIDLQQLLPGRKKGKACVKPTAKLKKAKKCVRAVSQGTLTRSSHVGANSVAFSGRIGSRALKPGNYQAVLTATDAARNASLRKTVAFKVLRG